MVAGCGNKFVKYIFFLFNFLFFVFGALILGLALWVRFDNNFQTRMSEALQKSSGTAVQLDQFYIAMYVAAGIGGLLCLLGFLGCCGACCESVCLLGLFFTVVLVLFVAEIAGAIYVFVKKDTLKETMADWYLKTLVQEQYYNNEEVKMQLDKIHEELGCCGARGCDDWGDQKPASCKCDEGEKPGCSYKIFETLSQHVVIVAAVSIGVLAVELLAMIFACILCNGIRSAAYDYY